MNAKNANILLSTLLGSLTPKEVQLLLAYVAQAEEPSQEKREIVHPTLEEVEEFI